MRFETEMCRLHDLVRYQRSELHEAGLISDDEYAQLAQDHSAVARLETYDSMKAQIAALKAERDALREALKLARTRIAHKFDCLAINPTEEWPEKGSTNFDGCSCEISVIDAALSTPASGEPARKP